LQLLAIALTKPETSRLWTLSVPAFYYTRTLDQNSSRKKEREFGKAKWRKGGAYRIADINAGVCHAPNLAAGPRVDIKAAVQAV
jgi:hypothetical protein